MQGKLMLVISLVVFAFGLAFTGVQSATIAQDSIPDQPIVTDWEGICESFPHSPECVERFGEPQLVVIVPSWLGGGVYSPNDQSVQVDQVQEQQLGCMITGNGTRIRFAPSTQNAKIWGSLSTTVPSLGTVLGEDGFTWFKIDINGGDFFLRGDVVQRSVECPEVVTPVVQQPAAIEPQQQVQQPEQPQQPTSQDSNPTPQPPIVEQPPIPTGVPTEVPIQHERRDAANYGQQDEDGNIYVAFIAGEAVVGAYILYDDGQTTSGYVPSTPQGGRVYGGVVWPWETEIP